MSETTVKPSRLGNEEWALEAFFLSCTVPFKRGGGLVFPIGFPGQGYELDARQFDCYQAEIAQVTLSDTVTRKKRLLIAGTILFGVVCAVGGIAAGLTMSPEAILLSAAYVLQAIFVFVAAMVALMLRLQQAKFRARFPKASPVSRFAHLHCRVLGTLAGHALAPNIFRLKTALLTLFGILLFLLALLSRLADATPLLAVTGVCSLLLFAIAGFYGYHLLVFRHFHRNHGCAPTPADMKSV
jgi:hypothetical protein